MSGIRRRPVWPWVAISAAALVVLTLLGSLVWRALNPPVVPFVEINGSTQVIQVNIVNSSNVDGAGKTSLRYLRERGFDVVELSTAADEVDTSYVIDRVGDRTSALKVAQVLGIADTLVLTEIDSMLFVRASVILGNDLKQLLPFNN